MEGKKELGRNGQIQPKMRKVLQIKGSCYLGIPKNIVTSLGIKPGDTLAVIAGTSKITYHLMKD